MDENAPTVPTKEAYGVIIRVSERDVQHRQDFVEYVLRDAEPWHRRHLTRLYGLWTQWNASYFESKLVVPYILLAEPRAPRTYGDCALVSGFGGKAQIRIRPSLLMGTHPHMQRGPRYDEGRFLFVAGVLLHETIHQFHQEVTGETERAYHGHGPAFKDKCNEIGADLGLPLVRDSKKRGADQDLPSCAQFPHCVRPADYYQYAYTPPTKQPALPLSLYQQQQCLELLRETVQALGNEDHLVSKIEKLLREVQTPGG